MGLLKKQQEGKFVQQDGLERGCSEKVREPKTSKWKTLQRQIVVGRDHYDGLGWMEKKETVKDFILRILYSLIWSAEHLGISCCDTSLPPRSAILLLLPMAPTAISQSTVVVVSQSLSTSGWTFLCRRTGSQTFTLDPAYQFSTAKSEAV